MLMVTADGAEWQTTAGLAHRPTIRKRCFELLPHLRTAPAPAKEHFGEGDDGWIARH